MAFPTSNLSLSSVLQAYTGNTTGSMNSLRGLTYYDPSPPFTSGIIPPIGGLFPLSLLFGKYSLNHAPTTVENTSGNPESCIKTHLNTSHHLSMVRKRKVAP